MLVYIGRLGIQAWVDRKVRFALLRNTRHFDDRQFSCLQALTIVREVNCLVLICLASGSRLTCVNGYIPVQADKLAAQRHFATRGRLTCHDDSRRRQRRIIGRSEAGGEQCTREHSSSQKT